MRWNEGRSDPNMSALMLLYISVLCANESSTHNYLFCNVVRTKGIERHSPEGRRPQNSTRSSFGNQWEQASAQKTAVKRNPGISVQLT